MPKKATLKAKRNGNGSKGYPNSAAAASAMMAEAEEVAGAPVAPPVNAARLAAMMALAEGAAGAPMAGAAPPWYAIPEIPFPRYVFCLSYIYGVLEKKHKSKSDADVFLKAVLQSYSGMPDAEWEREEQKRLYMKSMESKMGDFHEELMGQFPGYVCMPVGDESGCDVKRRDGSVFMEVKNRDNTMNSSSGKSVVDKLALLAARGVRAILVEVNCPGGKVNRYGAPASVEVWNGRQAYEFLSGRADFFDRLLHTLSETMRQHKEFDALLAMVGARGIKELKAALAV